MASKTKTKINSKSIKTTSRNRGVQVVSNSNCTHCGIKYTNVGQHTMRCLMNPDRKYRNGYRHCDNCKMSIAGPNYSRHINDCDGSAEDVVKRALQSFRSEFIKIIHNGDSAGRIDRTLGFGNRSVPEVVRANVERELLDRGMPSDWKITSSLLLDIPMKNVISDTELGVFAVTNSTASVKSDDYLFAIQVLQHHIAIYDNLSSVISDIIAANEV